MGSVDERPVSITFVASSVTESEAVSESGDDGIRNLKFKKEIWIMIKNSSKVSNSVQNLDE